MQKETRDIADISEISEVRRKNLLLWMDKRHLSQSDVARKADRGRAYVNMLVKSQKNFGEKMARHMERSLSMPDLWLDGAALDSQGSVSAWQGTQDIPARSYALVPGLYISVGKDGEVLSGNQNKTPAFAFEEEWLRSAKVSGKNNLRFLRVTDDSMSPFIEESDQVMIDMGQTDVVDGRVYCIRYANGLRLRRLFRKIDGGYRIVPDNRAYSEEHVSEEQVLVVGRQVWRAG